MDTLFVDIRLFIISAIIVSACALQDEKPIKCHTTPKRVTEGWPANFTCQFQEELRQGQSFGLYRKASGTSKGVIVALCKKMDGTVSCRNKEGFECRTVDPKKEATFEISHAQLTQTGDYECKTLPFAKATATSCSLAVNDVIAENPQTSTSDLVTCNAERSVSERGSVSVTCFFPHSIGNTGFAVDVLKGSETEEVISCDGEGRCSEWGGYKIERRTNTSLRARTPQVFDGQDLLFVCRSTALPFGARGTCMLPPEQVEDRNDVSLLQVLIGPLYAILVCLVLIIILAVAFVGFMYYRYRDHGNCSSHLKPASRTASESPLLKKPIVKETLASI